MRRIYSLINVKSSLISNMERANSMVAVNYFPINNDRYCLAVVLKFPDKSSLKKTKHKTFNRRVGGWLKEVVGGGQGKR